MEEALHAAPLYSDFARLDAGMARMPDETTVLRLRNLLEEHNLSIQPLAVNATLIAKGLLLKTGTVLDAALITAPSSTMIRSSERDPEMHQTKKSNQWHFDMNAYIGVDTESGLVHTLIGTAADVNGVTQGNGLLQGEETVVFTDAGYQGSFKRPEATGFDCYVAMRPGKSRALNKNSPWGSFLEKAQQLKDCVRVKAFAKCTGMSERATRASARQRPEKALPYRPNALDSDEAALRVSSVQLLPLNFRCGGVSADLAEARYW